MYTMYYDESNNCLKFKFKDADGDLNVDYTEDYVLAGVAFEGTESPMHIDAVFSKPNNYIIIECFAFRLQKRADPFYFAFFDQPLI